MTRPTRVEGSGPPRDSRRHPVVECHAPDETAAMSSRPSRPPSHHDHVVRPASALHAWVDATNGIAGDMLLGALIDAGAQLDVVQAAIEAVLPATVQLTQRTVQRAGIRALKVDVQSLVADHPHRSWVEIHDMISSADLVTGLRDRALAVFQRLAVAEGRVHGVPVDQVYFHEVGSWDSIADVVGSCAALNDLGVTDISVSTIAVGSGRVRSAHGDIPVPVPAVLELAAGWPVTSGGEGELTTPTGMALVTSLASTAQDLPALRVTSVGVGAGTRDPQGRPNISRVVIGVTSASKALERGEPTETRTMSVLETNVDDLDPRVWPSVLTALLEAGAADAWLTPILMKKGRPAHTLAVLTDDERLEVLRRAVFDLTSTIGIRETAVRRWALARTERTVFLQETGDHLDADRVGLRQAGVRVKVAHRDGVIVHATPEFEDVAALAARSGLAVRQVLDRAIAAAELAGLAAGHHLPN